jgi:hypothetical protein
MPTTLPSEATEDDERYTVVLFSSTYANSPADALGVFLCQMQTGDVTVEVRNDETGGGQDLSRLLDCNPVDQINLALGIIGRLGRHMTEDQKADLAQQAAHLQPVEGGLKP